MAKKGKTKEQKPQKSSFILPPDAKHFSNEDIALAPGALFNNMASDQTVRPTLLIVQPMSRMDGARKNIGRIYNTLTKEFHDKLEIAIFVAPSANDVPRALKAKKFDRNGDEVFDYNAPVICASPNGVHPYGNYPGTKINKEEGEAFEGEVIPDECSQCVFNSAYLCKEYFRYFALAIEPGGRVTPVVVRFKGMALGPAKLLNTRLAEYDQRGEYWTFEFTTEETQGRNNDAIVYVPHFEPSRRITDPEFLRYVAAMNKEYRDKQERVLENGNLRLEQIKEDLKD